MYLRHHLIGGQRYFNVVRGNRDKNEVNQTSDLYLGRLDGRSNDEILELVEKVSKLENAKVLESLMFELRELGYQDFFEKNKSGMIVDEDGIKARYNLIRDHLDEKARRMFLGAEANAIGKGGQKMVSRLTGVGCPAIRRGMSEVKQLPSEDGRIRKPGGGRRKTVESDPSLVTDLERLINPETRGDPMSPLRWTTKSLNHLTKALVEIGHSTSTRMIAQLLHELGYSLQANRKTREGKDHPDRNWQFEHINHVVLNHMTTCDPVISVDTKKKEKIGDFKTNGRELNPK